MMSVKRAGSLFILFIMFFCIAWLVGPLLAGVVVVGAGGDLPDLLINASKILSNVDLISVTGIISWFDRYKEPDFYRYDFLTACTIFALLQVAFVAPLVGPLRLAPSGRSLRASVIVAALAAGFLVLALVASVADAIVIFGGPAASRNSEHSLLTVIGISSIPELLGWGEFFISWLICSSIMAFLIWNAGHTRNPNALGRWTRRLFAGTIIELVLSIPIFFFVQRKNSCYCALVSFWSVVAGLAGLVWLCGPAAILLATRTSRRAWGHKVCVQCGYERRSTSVRCSECGHEFKDDRAPSLPSAGR